MAEMPKILVTSAKEPKELFGLSQTLTPNAQAWEEIKELPSIHAPVQDIESDIILSAAALDR